jgi:hypothetical protein
MILIRLDRIEHACDNSESARSSPDQTIDVGRQYSAGVVNTDDMVFPRTERYDLLGVNEWQKGRCESSWQVKALMMGDHGHPRAMQLLPFAAAATQRLPFDGGWSGQDL